MIAALVAAACVVALVVTYRAGYIRGALDEKRKHLVLVDATLARWRSS